MRVPSTGKVRKAPKGAKPTKAELDSIMGDALEAMGETRVDALLPADEQERLTQLMTQAAGVCMAIGTPAMATPFMPSLACIAAMRAINEERERCRGILMSVKRSVSDPDAGDATGYDTAIELINSGFIPPKGE